VIDEVWNAWAAGFVDGEGSVMLIYSRPKQITRCGRVETKPGQVAVHVRASQTVEVPLLRLEIMYGGSVKALDMSMKSRFRNVRQMYEWNIFGGNAISALRKMRPYMMVKQQHADLAVEYYELCNGGIGNLDLRLKFWEEMRELQHKGIHLRKPAIA